jgi:O-antigen ligase
VLARERIVPISLVAGATCIAVLWPLSAYAVNPIALPSILMVTAVAVLMLQRPEYGLALALALAPVINATLPAGSSGQVSLPSQPFQVLVPILAAGVLVYGFLVIRSPTNSGPNQRMVGIGILAFTASALLSSSRALDPSASVAKVLLIATAALVFFAVRQIVRNRDQLLVVVGGAIAGLLVASVQGIADHLLGVDSTLGFVSGTEVIGRVQGSFGHPNIYGGFLALLMPVAVAVAFGPAFPRFLRWLAAVAAAAAVPALVFSYARGAVIGLVVGTVLILSLARPKLAVASLVAFALIAFVFAPTALKDRFNPSSSGGDVTLRSDIWNGALEIYSSQPVLGVGINNFQVAYASLPTTSSGSSQRRLLHDTQLLVPPHAQSIYLQALAEQGLVGLLALATLLGSAVLTTFRAARATDSMTRTLGIGLGIGVIGLMVHGLLEIPLYSESILPLMGLLAVVATLVDTERATAVETAVADPQLNPAAAV